MSDIYSEAEKAKREIALEDYRENIAEVAERLRYQVEFSQSALKNLHLVNGGSILALLTFLGNADLDFNYRAVWWAFVWFSMGLITSLAAHFGANFSQAHFMNLSAKQSWNAQLRARGLREMYDIKPDYTSGNRFVSFGIAAAFLSLLFFILGAFVGLGGLK